MLLRRAGFLRDAIISPLVTHYSRLSGGVEIKLHKGHVHLYHIVSITVSGVDGSILFSIITVFMLRKHICSILTATQSLALNHLR
jgi:hypothetical protein